MQSGRREVFDRLLSLVYPELRQIARARMRGNEQTWHPTDLVHEAYLKMVKYQDVDWKGRAHFFGAAASTMRRLLIDRARSKATDKRKGEMVTMSIAEAESVSLSMEQLIDLDDLLQRLEKEKPRWVRIVECRYFAGLTIPETAEVIGVSAATVSNDWTMARAWLRAEMNDS